MKSCFFAAIAILLVAAIPCRAAQDDKFTVSTEEVRLDVLVTDKGKPLSGLKADDFEIFDNGVRQEIQYVTLQKQTPITVVLVFDMSRSVAGELLLHLKNAASGILSDLQREDHAALITFNSAVVLGAMPTRNFSFVKTALEALQPFGNSSLFDGTYAGLILAQARPDPTLVIIFSDGRDTFSWLTSDAVLEAAKRSDAVVYAVSTSRMFGETLVGAGFLLESSRRKPDPAFLDEVTKSTGGALMKTESSADLVDAFHRTLEEFRQRYTVTYTPRGVAESGWHKLEVRVKYGAAKIQVRPGYMRSLSSK